MVKIGIIDSGLDHKSKLRRDVIGGVSFCIENDTMYMTDVYDDECGHGTQCAEIIKKYCENAELYIVKIVDESGFCDSVLLLQALEHLCDVELDIINISLSIANDNYREQFEEVIEKLYRQGKKINISVRNGENNSFPADVSNCYGVIGSEDETQRYKYYPKECIQIHANLYPEYVPTIDESKQWFGGNSKATAMMSGIMGRWIQDSDSIADVIENNIINGIDGLVETQKYQEIKDIDKKIIFDKISKALSMYYKCGTVSYDSRLWTDKECCISDMSNFLLELEKILQIDMNNKIITYDDMSTCDRLITYLCRALREAGREIL